MREQYESGEAFGSEVGSLLMPLVNPVGAIVAEAGKTKRKRSKKQKAMDKRRSEAWAQANSEGRKNNGEYRAGWDQKRIAERANKMLRKL